MAIKRNESLEDSVNSLDDSAYDILTDVASDDEEYDGKTESLASRDDHTPDDVTSDADAEASDHQETSNVPETLVASETMLDHHQVQGTAPTDSVLTARLSPSSSVISSRSTTGSSLPDRIPFTQTLSSFDEPDMPEALRQHNADHLRLTLRQTLAKTYYAPAGPFRVLYVGAQWAKSEITSKIAAAIYVSRAHSGEHHAENEKISGSPITTHPAGQQRSDVEANMTDLTSITVIIDEVSSACVTATGDISIALNDGMAVRSLEDWARQADEERILPHIAIIFAAKGTDMQMSETILYTNDAMSHLNVPVIYIAEDPFRSLCLHNTQTEYDEVHMCVEALPEGGTGNTVIRRLPLDLPAFLSLDNALLNRNLACISAVDERPGLFSHTFGFRPMRLQQSVIMAELKKQATEIYERVVRLSPTIHWAGIFLLLSVVLGLLFSTLQPRVTSSLSPSGATSQATVRLPQSYAKMSSVSPSSATTILSNKAIKSGSKAAATVSPKALTVANNNRSISNAVAKFANSLSLTSTNRDLSVLPTKEEAAKVPANTSDRFKVSAVGTTHLLVVAPENFARTKKVPPIFAQAISKNKAVDLNITKITDGVYAIVVPKEISYGSLNLTIWTKSKPVLKQSFEVQLGSSMSGSLRSAAERFLQLTQAQSKLANDLFGRVGGNVRPAISSLQSSSHDMWNATIHVLKQTVDTCATRANQVSKHTKSASKGFIRDLGNRTASTSKALIKQSRQRSGEFGTVMRALNQKLKSLDQTAMNFEKVISNHLSTLLHKAIMTERKVAKYVSQTPALRMPKAVGKARERAKSLLNRFSARKAEAKERRKHTKGRVSTRKVKKGTKRGRV